jgi:hypothetical protein
MPTQTEIERRLLDELRRVCGAPLGDFLLAGYGADEAVERRAYVVHARISQCLVERRYIEVRNDSETGLPCGREPLVWAAVLLTFFEGPRDSYVVGRRYRHLLETMGMTATAEGRAFIEDALAKYLRLTIIEVKAHQRMRVPGDEHIFVTRQHPVVEFQSTGRAMTDNVLDDGASFGLEFNRAFSTGLINGGLFAAEWVELAEIEPTAWNGTAAEVSKVLKHITTETEKS